MKSRINHVEIQFTSSVEFFGHFRSRINTSENRKAKTNERRRMSKRTRIDFHGRLLADYSEIPCIVTRKPHVRAHVCTCVYVEAHCATQGRRHCNVTGVRYIRAGDDVVLITLQLASSPSNTRKQPR